jgi:hypothetical protein
MAFGKRKREDKGHVPRRGRRKRERQVPGSVQKVPAPCQTVVWTHRGERPLIHVSSTNRSDADGSGVRVEIIPCSFWDEDPRFLDIYGDILRDQSCQEFGKSSFCPNKGYVFIETMHYP